MTIVVLLVACGSSAMDFDLDPAAWYDNDAAASEEYQQPAAVSDDVELSDVTPVAINRAVDGAAPRVCLDATSAVFEQEWSDCGNNLFQDELVVPDSVAHDELPQPKEISEEGQQSEQNVAVPVIETVEPAPSQDSASAILYQAPRTKAATNICPFCSVQYLSLTQHLPRCSQLPPFKNVEVEIPYEDGARARWRKSATEKEQIFVIYECTHQVCSFSSMIKCRVTKHYQDFHTKKFPAEEDAQQKKRRRSYSQKITTQDVPTSASDEKAKPANGAMGSPQLFKVGRALTQCPFCTIFFEKIFNHLPCCHLLPSRDNLLVLIGMANSVTARWHKPIAKNKYTTLYYLCSYSCCPFWSLTKEQIWNHARNTHGRHLVDAESSGQQGVLVYVDRQLFMQSTIGVDVQACQRSSLIEPVWHAPTDAVAVPHDAAFFAPDCQEPLAKRQRVDQSLLLGNTRANAIQIE